MRAVIAPYRAKFLRIAQCESTGRWHIVNPPYEGGLQFTASSYRAAGGHGRASRASPLTQMYVAVRLMRLQGWGAWPICGSR